MAKYKSEILETTFKFFDYGVNETDLSRLDELINQRDAEGWEFVTYSYVGNAFGSYGKILVTYRKY